jgi:hypothetical protein
VPSLIRHHFGVDAEFPHEGRVGSAHQMEIYPTSTSLGRIYRRTAFSFVSGIETFSEDRQDLR